MHLLVTGGAGGIGSSLSRIALVGSATRTPAGRDRDRTDG